jgi:hypothetical protein
MILKICIFAKKMVKKLPFWAQNKAELCKKWTITSVFGKNAIFRLKSHSIVIITLTPGYCRIDPHN